ncbi:Coenzyme F420 hydrogenase/dehydrogenase, beta subunit C-terminal domain [Methanosarcina sp. T3]|uniref:Coenzyme F420 hydrogenase/dehydrogenase, beta subunit C-terminal domain n=1 Tax=Methanosarcina sp. T3 TaxID=3439062 RepID=UPI003F84073D
MGDISTSSAGSPEGWFTVFIRTGVGNDVWSKAVADGMFEKKPIEEIEPGLELVMKLSKMKLGGNRETLEEMKNFGVNKALQANCFVHQMLMPQMERD